MKQTKHLWLILIFFPAVLKAQSPNWAQDIAPILYSNCTKCHHSGGLAPFALMTYNDAFAVQAGLQDAVVNKRMPPWPPDPSYVLHAHPKLLTQAEITSIDDWVNNGAPSGNLSLAPAPPVYTNASQIPNPDLSLVIPAYTVGSTTDIYRCFPLPSGLTAQQFITSMEVIPGNPAIVHHVLVFADNAVTCLALDSADPGPGYTNFGGPGSNTAKLIGAWVPGAEPYTLPAGLGISLDSATTIIVQVHYPAGSLGMLDTTRMNFKLSPPPMREVSIIPVLNHASTLVNGPLYIAANATKTFHEKYTLPAALDISLLSVAPHMHLIGRNFRSYAVTPSSDTIPFIRINNWDFRWQGNYAFQKVLKVPGGSTLHAFALYDNTSGNLFNPNTPPQPVSAGESTTDEMMLEYFFFLPYQAGDENIIQDSAAVTGIDAPPLLELIQSPQLYDVYPNPSGNVLTIRYCLPVTSSVRLVLTDLQGKTIRVIREEQGIKPGFHAAEVNTAGLAGGTYLLSLEAGGFRKSKSFLKE